MYELKTNTAARIVVGPAVDPDDLLAKLSLDVTDISVQICRMAQDGSAVILSAFTPTASGGDNDMVHISGDTAGMYDLELTASQLNFLGPARIILYDEDKFIIHWVDILVLSAAYYDWKYGSTIPEVDLVLIDGETIDVTEAQLGVNVVEADSIAWEDEERLSKLDVIQENTTDIKRVTDNISSSTRAVRDNTKISAAAGYAFIDFGDAAIFANHIASHSKLVITDSAGKKLTGYIKAAGTGETYGEELITNGDFEDGLTGWSLSSNADASVVPDGAGGNWLKLTQKDLTTFAQIYQSKTGNTGYLLRGNIGRVSASHNIALIFSIAGRYPEKIIPSGESTDISLYINAWTTVTLIIDISTRSYFTTAHVDSVSLHRVLTPSATGVTITSTPDGAIQDWTNVEADFNFYDAAGYTVTLPGNQFDLLYTEKKLMLTNLDTKVSSRSTLTAAQVWANAARTLTSISDSSGVTTLLSRIGATLSFTSGNVHVHVKAKDNLDFGALEKASLNAATPAVTVSDKTGFSLTNDYDAAKTAATQASVNAIPTTPVLASDARLNNLDATITSRLADSKYVAPANDDIAAIKAKTDNLPASPAAVGSEMVLTSAYDAAKTAASQSSVNSIPTNPLLTNDTRLNNLNATIASRLAADNYIAPANDNITAIKAVTDKLDDTLELADGKNRFTEAALAEGSAADVSAVIDDLVDGFLDAQLIGHDIVGSVGAAIAASSASGDPWATELPGTYTTGTAGNIIGTKTASAEEIREELDTRSSKFSILGRILKF